MGLERRSTRARAVKTTKVAEKHSDDEDAEKPEENLEEEQVPERRPKKAASKPALPAAATDALAVPKRGTKRAAPNEELHGLELLDILSKHPQSVPQAAKDWVKSFKQDKVEAMTRLMTLIGQVAGYETEMSPEDVEEGDMDDLVKKMTVHLLKSTIIDPLHDKRLKSFPTSYETFWLNLIHELHQTGLLMDNYLVGRITAFVTGLCVSPLRNFRYCGTVTSSHIMSGWVDIQMIYKNNITRFQFQAATEEKKRVNKELAESLKLQAEAENKRAHELETASKALMTATFSFRFRDYSDEVRRTVIKSYATWVEKAPDIYLQDTYLKYLGWALSDKDGSVRYEAAHGILSLYKTKENVPQLAEFKGRFERRFREMSRDADERVAIKSLELLSQLVEKDQVDRDSVRVEIYPLLAASSPALRQAASSLVATLLLDTAAQAEERKLKEDKDDKEGGGPVGRGGRKGKKGASVSEEDEQARRHKVAMQCQLATLLDLMEILVQTQMAPPTNQGAGSSSAAAGVESITMTEEEVAKLVHCLYGRLPVFGDCRSLLSALIDDDLITTRGQSGAIHVAWLLASSAKMASSASLPSTGPPAKSKKAAALPQGDSLMELSLELIDSLPKLITKHQTDRQATRALVGLIPHLRLEVYTMGGREKEFGALVKLVSEQLFRHVDDLKTLAQVAEVLVFCADRGPAGLQPSAQLVQSETVVKASGQLAEAAAKVRKLDPEDLKDQVEALNVKGEGAVELYALKCALTRIGTLLMTGSRLVSSHEQVYECLHGLIEESVNGRKLGVETTTLLLSGMNSLLAWSLIRLHKMSGGHVPTQEPEGFASAAALPISSNFSEALSDLRAKVNVYIKQLLSLYSPLDEELLEEEEGEDHPTNIQSSNAKMCDLTLLCLSDVLLLFTGQTWVDEEERSKAVAQAQAALSKEGDREIILGIEAPDDSVRKLWVMCQDQLRRSAPSKDEPALPSLLGEMDLPALVSFTMRLRAVGALSKLLRSRSCLSHRHFRWLAAHLASKMVSYGSEAQELIKDLLRACRTNRPSVMPEVYVGAMKLAYNTVIEERQALMSDEGGEGSLASVHHDFQALCQNLAAMYVGHSIHREELMRIVRNGVSFAMNDAPSNLTFLSWGLDCFTSKLTQEDARILADELEEQIKESLYIMDDHDWKPLATYLGRVKERATKGRGAARGAIKGSKVEGGGSRSRRITFAPQEGEEENEEAEEEADDEAMEEAKKEEAKKEEVGMKRGRKAAAGGKGKEEDAAVAPPSKKTAAAAPPPPAALPPSEGEVSKPSAGAAKAKVTRGSAGVKESQKPPAPVPAPAPAPAAAAEVHEASQMTTGSIEPPAKTRRRR